jgi:hypothetical protein
MKNSKTINTFTAHIVEQLVTDRDPIHTYRKAILAAKPYISFVYIDADTLPTVTNIPLVRPSLCTRFIDDATLQPELHVLYRGDSTRGCDGQTSKIQVFTLSTQTNSVEVTIPIGEQHVSYDSTFNLKDRREIPFVQFRALDSQANSVEVTIPVEEQRVFWDATFNLKDRREIPLVQSLTIDAQVTSLKITIPIIEEQHISLDATINTKDQREMQVVRSLALDAQTSTVEKTISCTTLRPSLAVTFNPADQREKLTLQSLKQDVRASSVEKTISIVEQKASLDVVFDHDKKHEEISTIPYILDNRSAQYTNATSREEQKYDSYNQSIAIMEPRCHDYPVSKTRTRCRIVRYHRYSRTSHIVYSQYKAETSSGNHQHPDHTSIEDR